jgi:PAS domain S-box-containing protein
MGVELEPVVLQAGFAVPVTAGLVLYTLLRHERSPLHLLIAATLATVVVWMSALLAGMLLPEPSFARRVAFDVEILGVALMPPLCVITMARIARSPVFEQGMAPALALFAVSGLLFAAYASDGRHHLFVSDPAAALRGEHPRLWAGPLYWSLVLWSHLCSAIGIGFIAGAIRRGRTPSERKRAAMVLGAILTPIAAHLVYLLECTPLDFSLATGAMAPSAFFFLQGATRYGLLVAQPIVRQDVIEHFPDGILLADEEGIVLDANGAAESALGVARGELVGRALRDALTCLGEPDADQPIGDRVAALPLRGERFSEEIRTRDGRAIEITAGAVAALGSQPAGRFVALRDRSEQRRGERLLQERQKLESVGILAAGVAHEVNNPLAYVRANLAHLQKLSGELEKQLSLAPGRPGSALLEFPEILAESLEGLDRIARIVESMLRFSRLPEEGRRGVRVNELVEDALRLAALHRSHGVRVERRLGDGLPEVLGTAQRLVQVVLNLLLNARQALEGRADARIVAQTRCAGASIEIAIADNGPGIPEAQRRRIFDPFFTTRAPGEGTGLGLSIASEIVHEHGGTLECDSTPGEGSCFTIRLPVAEGG